jgi:UDPglucose--hexose-1-phosphate uridylyltransferase
VSGSSQPHRRFNPLTGRWVLTSAGRTQRPWHGREEAAAEVDRPAYDPACHLCPGNVRANGERNPDYDATFVFSNDYPSLFPARHPGETPDSRAETPWSDAASHPLLRAQAESGACRVVCFSPRHDLTLARMEVNEVRRVVDVWAEQVDELRRAHAWVQVFENRGAEMGASNPHPHGQIWASSVVPDEPAIEDRCQAEYRAARGSVLLLDYAELEEKRGDRVVASNDDWIVVVPFWAVWPFETLVLPRRPVANLPELIDAERESLARILKSLLARYDNLFEHSFPYSMGWHGCMPGSEAHAQLHAHFYPPLLRSPTIRKFMVGYEMLADVQRDLTAEDAAERLRAVSSVHHRRSSGSTRARKSARKHES